MRRGFHQSRAGEDWYQAWLAGVRADGTTMLGAWAEDTAYASSIPVATFASWTGELNVGGSMLPAHLISDVTVAPTHRRQGLLRKLMTVNLADAVAAGLPLAALTVSEGSIYGRFGFGMATHVSPIDVEVSERFRFRADALTEDDGRLVLAEPKDAWPAVAEVFTRFHTSSRGSITRPHYYEQWLSSAFDHRTGSKDETRQRVVLHLDAAGEPDGYAVYTLAEERDDAGQRWLTISDLIGLTPPTYLRLWRYLADVDLVHGVRWHRAPVENPLRWALEEPFVVKKTEIDEMIWVRVLDVPRALEARPWYSDGRVVLGVDDPLGHAAGSWELAVSGGEAKVASTDAAAEVTLAADTLGALYLGGVSVSTLAAAGRVRGSGVETFAALADGGPAPYCITGF